MPTINFKTELFSIAGHTILLLPKDASAKLPSRGMVIVKGTIDGSDFNFPLEPDGRRSHWLEVGKTMQQAAGFEAGDNVTVKLEPTKDWPEPKVPADIAKALNADKKVKELWDDITPMARWEWIRWIRATNRAETRTRRIEVARSKLKGGSRRPCCFNASMCTEPSVSKNGVLLEPVLVA